MCNNFTLELSMLWLVKASELGLPRFATLCTSAVCVMVYGSCTRRSMYRLGQTRISTEPKQYCTQSWLPLSKQKATLSQTQNVPCVCSSNNSLSKALLISCLHTGPCMVKMSPPLWKGRFRVVGAVCPRKEGSPKCFRRAIGCLIAAIATAWKAGWPQLQCPPTNGEFVLFSA